VQIWVEGVVGRYFWVGVGPLVGSFWVGDLWEEVGFAHWCRLVGVPLANLDVVQNLVGGNLGVNLGSFVGVGVVEAVLWVFLHHQ